MSLVFLISMTRSINMGFFFIVARFVSLGFSADLAR